MERRGQRETKIEVARRQEWIYKKGMRKTWRIRQRDQKIGRDVNNYFTLLGRVNVQIYSS